MHFYKLIKNLAKEKTVNIYVDMDGVIAAYNLEYPLDFLHKRALTNNIKILNKINQLPNVTLHILSVCQTDNQIKDKNTWLDINAPFFSKENLVIISKESNNNLQAKKLKLNYLKTLTDKNIIMIDDDNDVLKYLAENLKNITFYQDSELID